MENRIRQGYQLEVSKNLVHRLEGKLVSNCGNSEIELSKNELLAFNRFIVVKGNILNAKKLTIDYSLDEGLFTAKMKKTGKKGNEYTTALVQSESLINTLNNLNDYLAWYGKDTEQSIDKIMANLDKGYNLVLLNNACSFIKTDSNYQNLLISKAGEKTASIFTMFPNIMKKLSDNDTMIMAIMKENDKYIIKEKDFLTGKEERSRGYTDLLEGLVIIDKNLEREKKGRKIYAKNIISNGCRNG